MSAKYRWTANGHMAQFGLASLFEFTAVCSVLSFAAIYTGNFVGITLMLFALALWTRRGWLALTVLAIASFAANLPASASSVNSSDLRQFLLWLVAAGLCGWYSKRRAWTDT